MHRKRLAAQQKEKEILSDNASDTVATTFNENSDDEAKQPQVPAYDREPSLRQQRLLSLVTVRMRTWAAAYQIYPT